MEKYKLTYWLILVSVITTKEMLSMGCSGPQENFLRYGEQHGDTRIGVTTYAPGEGIIDIEDVVPMPYTVFGSVDDGTTVKITGYGMMLIGPDTDGPRNLAIIYPKLLWVTTQTLADLVGDIYFRYTTASEDLEKVNDLLCGNYEHALVATYECVGPSATSALASYQLVIAHGGGRTVFLFIFGFMDGDIDLSSINTVADFNHYIRINSKEYPLNSADRVSSNSLIAIDVTDTLQVPGGQPMPRIQLDTTCNTPPGRVCEIYPDGDILTLSGYKISGLLNKNKNYVASVDGNKRDENEDNCKFFLMIPAKNQKPKWYARFAVGIHPKNDKKYFRKFQFYFSDGRLTQFGWMMKPQQDIDPGSTPFTMDDSKSDLPLNIQIDRQDSRWILSSITCPYTVTFWSTGKVTLEMNSDLYDGRISGACAET